MASDTMRRARRDVQEAIMDKGLDGVRNPSSAARTDASKRVVSSLRFNVYTYTMYKHINYDSKYLHMLKHTYLIVYVHTHIYMYIYRYMYVYMYGSA